MLPGRGQRGGDLKFMELTAELSDQQAAVLWLRYYRGMTVARAAELLKVSPATVNAWTLAAVAELQKKWANCSIGKDETY